MESTFWCVSTDDESERARRAEGDGCIELVVSLSEREYERLVDMTEHPRAPSDRLRRLLRPGSAK